MLPLVSRPTPTLLLHISLANVSGAKAGGNRQPTNPFACPLYFPFRHLLLLGSGSTDHFLLLCAFTISPSPISPSRPLTLLAKQSFFFASLRPLLPFPSSSRPVLFPKHSFLLLFSISIQSFSQPSSQSSFTRTNSSLFPTIQYTSSQPSSSSQHSARNCKHRAIFSSIPVFAKTHYFLFPFTNSPNHFLPPLFHSSISQQQRNFLQFFETSPLPPCVLFRPPPLPYSFPILLLLILR